MKKHKKEKGFITYEPLDGGDQRVFLEGVHIGDIKFTMPRGFAYYPKGNHGHGQQFATIREVKDSIEAK